MGDLLVFVAIVGLMIAVGIALGMIVATRLDRIMTQPRPEAPAPPGGAETDGTPATAAGAAPTKQEPHP